MKKILISLELLLLVIFIGYSNVGAYMSGVSGDIIYYALYNDEYKIFETTVSGINYMVNEKLSMPTKEGYKFDGWYYDKDFSVKVKSNTSQNLDLEKLRENTLYGRWVKDTSIHVIPLIIISLLFAIFVALIIIIFKKYKQIIKKFSPRKKHL